MAPAARPARPATKSWRSPSTPGFGDRMAGFVGGLALAAVACAADPDREELAALHAEIVNLIGTATCANLVHCRALALGTRPCGGPAEYLAYSSFHNDRELLETKAFEYTLLHEEIQRKETVADTCVVLPPPRLQCIDRHCRIENAQP
jgi:hypothetical protein